MRTGFIAIALSMMFAPVGTVMSQEIEEIEIFEKTNLNSDSLQFVSKFASAMKSGPESNSAKFIVQSSELGVQSARAQMYPSLNVGAVGSSTSTVDNRASATVQLRQPLYTGGRISGQIERAQEDVKISLERSNLILENLGYDMLRSYLQVDQLSYQIAAGNQLIEQLELVLKSEQDKVDMGAGRINDVYFVQGRINTAKDRQINLETQFLERKSALERHIGYINLEPGQRLPTLSIPKKNIPTTLEETIRLAMFGNTEVRQSELNVNRAKSTVEIEKSANLPNIDLVAIKQKLDSSDPISGSRDNDSINIQINFNAFSGGQTSSRIEQASFAVATAKEDLEISRRNVAQSAKDRWQRMNAATRKVPVQQNALQNNLLVLKERKVLRNYGKESVQSLVDSIEDYFASVQATIQTVFESKLAGLDLSLVSGKLRQKDKNHSRFFAAFFGRESLERSFLSMINAPSKSSDEIDFVNPLDLSKIPDQPSPEHGATDESWKVRDGLKLSKLVDRKAVTGNYKVSLVKDLNSDSGLELVFEKKWKSTN